MFKKKKHRSSEGSTVDNNYKYDKYYNYRSYYAYGYDK